MAHGTPDWGITNAFRTLYQVADMGELAARLASPDRFDRAGDIIFMDSFEEDLVQWPSVGATGGGTVDVSLNRARTGSFSARLVTGEPPPVATFMTASLSPSVFSPYGVEYSFMVDVLLSGIEVWVFVYTGTQLIEFRVRIVPVSGSIELFTAAGGYQSIALAGQLSTAPFHTLKFVVDPTSRAYGRVLLNSLKVADPGLFGRVSASAAAPHVDLTINCDDLDTGNRVSYIDDVIFTQNDIL